MFSKTAIERVNNATGKLRIALLFSLFFLLSSQLKAQENKTEKPDSLVKEKTLVLDSVKLSLLAKSDSSSVQWLSKKDSILQSLNNKPDSLQMKAHHVLDSSLVRVNTTLDSLNKLANVPAGIYQKTVDSVYVRFQKNVLDKIKNPGDTLNTSVNKRIASIESTMKSKTQRLDSLMQVYGVENRLPVAGRIDATIPSSSPDLPGSNLLNPDFTLPTDTKLSLPNSPSLALPELDIPFKEEITAVTSKVGEAGNLVKEAGTYAKDVNTIKEEGLMASEKLPELAEQKLLSLEQVAPVKQELLKGEAIKKQMEVVMPEAPSQEELQREAWKKTQEKAVDHFAGHEEVLEGSIDKVNAYKQKYETVGSVVDINKKPVNPLKAKPLIERIVPGFYLQYQRKGYYMLDVNPYAGYQLKTWLTTGAGWSHRFIYEGDHPISRERSLVYGPRIFADAGLGKGFVLHVETEMMNCFVADNIVNKADVGKREWVWGMQTGLKKEFPIYRGFRGIVLIQYNLFDFNHSSPYADRLNSRIGFQWYLKKKKSQTPSPPEDATKKESETK